MKQNTVLIFFIISLICAGLSIGNYEGVTIINKANSLSNLKGNTGSFLQIDKDSSVVSSFNQYGDKIYTENALTVQDTPARINLLNNSKDPEYYPVLKLSSFRNDDIDIQTAANHDVISSIGVNTNQSNSDYNLKLSCGNTRLAFSGDNINSSHNFIYAPYMGDIIYINLFTAQFVYHAKINTNYALTNVDWWGVAGQNHTDHWFELPNNCPNGSYINYIFADTNINASASNATYLRLKWGPPPIYGFLNNYNTQNMQSNQTPGKTGNGGFGIQRSGSHDNITCYANLNAYNGSFSYPGASVLKFLRFNGAWHVELETTCLQVLWWFQSAWDPPSS